MKILLVRPRPHNDTIGLKHVMICEPLELEYLMSNIPGELQAVCHAEIVDMILEKKAFAEILREKQPSVVFFTGYITHVNTILDMAKEVKQHLPSAITGVGGVHAEVVPMQFQHEDMDLVLGRNGVKAFQAALRAIAQGVSPDKVQERIQAIAEEPLDFTMNRPDRASVAKYRSAYYYMFHNPCALIKTSYGCPYNCSFCFCKEITAGGYYARPMTAVIEELLEIPEEEIYIVDDDFLFNKQRLEEFIRRLKENNIEKKYLVYGRADFIAENRELMQALKEVGLRAVIVGIESIRARDLESYDKRTSKEINEKCIAILKELDIELYATMIVPLDFSKQDFKELTHWLRAQRVIFVNLQPLTPLIGTDIFDEYRDKLLYDVSENHVFDMAHVVLRPEKMSVRMFYLRLLWSYYRVVTRPINILTLVKKHGVGANVKMLRGSQLVALQYWQKIIRGY